MLDWDHLEHIRFALVVESKDAVDRLLLFLLGLGQVHWDWNGQVLYGTGYVCELVVSRQSVHSGYYGWVLLMHRRNMMFDCRRQ